MVRSLMMMVALGAWALLAAALTSAQTEEILEVPLDNLRPVMWSGFEVQMDEAQDVDEGRPAVMMRFKKTSDERRLLALEGVPAASAAGARSLVIRYQLALVSGQQPRLAVVIFDGAGGSWAKVTGPSIQAGGFSEERVSVATLRRTAFSQNTEPELDWSQVSRIWVGFVFDGPAEGELAVSRAWLSSEPYRAATPLRVTGDDNPGKWSVSQDGAVRSSLTTPNEGPDGRPCMKYEFTMPGLRHMFAIPFTYIPPSDLDGYSALQFTYRAILPDSNIPGLLVTLWERGGAQYMAQPAPPASDEWTTVVLPFSNFVLGGWTKDDNGKLDPGQLTTVAIGLHGSAKTDPASGTIWVTDVQFVP